MSKRKRKKGAGRKERRSIVFRAVVFLSVPFFKRALALMALPYAALGVRAGARHCTVPAEVELQWGVGLKQALVGSSSMAPQVNLQTYSTPTGCLQ